MTKPVSQLSCSFLSESAKGRFVTLHRNIFEKEERNDKILVTLNYIFVIC